MSRASCLLALGSSHLKFDVWPTWALDVDKAQALNSRLRHLILKLASCIWVSGNTCNHPCLKSLHAARALKENWFSFQKNESRKNKLQQLLQAVDWHAHRLFQKLKTVQSSIITMIKIMISILKRNCIMHLSAAIRGGRVIPGSPRSFAQRRLQIPLTQNQDCLTKSY